MTPRQSRVSDRRRSWRAQVLRRIKARDDPGAIAAMFSGVSLQEIDGFFEVLSRDLPQEAEEFLVYLLETDQYDLGYPAAEALASYSGAESEAALVRAMRSPDVDPPIRSNCAESLGKRKALDRAADLIATLHDPDLFVRTQVVRALAELEYPGLVPLFKRALEGEPVGTVRVELLSELIYFGDSQSLDPLVQFVGEDDVHSSEHALRHLLKLAEEGLIEISPEIRNLAYSLKNERRNGAEAEVAGEIVAYCER